jgi:hypothetical protein
VGDVGVDVQELEHVEQRRAYAEEVPPAEGLLLHTEQTRQLYTMLDARPLYTALSYHTTIGKHPSQSSVHSTKSLSERSQRAA